MKSVILGSTVSVLLALSAISYAKPFIQGQEPARAPFQPAVQPAQNSSQQPGVVSATDAGKTEAKGLDSTATPAVTDALPVNPGNAKAVTSTAPAGKSVETTSAAAAESYVATAYSLKGRTASGKPVSRGLIAADPAVLPLGTRVRVEAGSLSGEYLVADTGGAIKGRRIDIWTPTTRQALQFGRRPVKVTVLAFGAKPESRTRAKRKH